MLFHEMLPVAVGVIRTINYLKSMNEIHVRPYRSELDDGAEC